MLFAHLEGDGDTARDLLLNLGVINQGGFLAYSVHLAAELGVRSEFKAAQSELRRDRAGDTVRRKAADDLQSLRQEMNRRGWS